MSVFRTILVCCQVYTFPGKNEKINQKYFVDYFQYFGHPMWRTDSLEKTLMLGKIEGGRRRGRQRMRCLEASLTQWTWVWVSSRSWWWKGKPGMLQSMGSQRGGHNWAELNKNIPFFLKASFMQYTFLCSRNMYLTCMYTKISFY